MMIKVRARVLPGKLLADSGPGTTSPGPGIRFELMMRTVLLAFMALATAQGVHAQKTSIVTAVRMEADRGHEMVEVPCRVNGTEHTYICVIDSGATNTIISDRVLKGEGPVIDVTTGNGVVRVHQREVSLTIAGGLELKSKAYVQSTMTEGVDILVGQDVLRQFKFVTFDYENRQVEFQR
jgi:gag-polyprotein putative aspartyl protease